MGEGRERRGDNFQMKTRHQLAQQYDRVLLIC